MNKELQDYARSVIVENLLRCTQNQRHVFKKMYSHNDLSKSIEEIVETMDESNLDRVMQQVSRTLMKNIKPME